MLRALHALESAVYYSPDSTIEFEVRRGTATERGFVPGVSEKEFEAIAWRLKTDGIVAIATDSVDVAFSDGLRVSVTSDGKITSIFKRRNGNFDILSPGRDYRISASTERRTSSLPREEYAYRLAGRPPSAPIPPPPEGFALTSIRRKARRSYDLGDRIQLDLTRVENDRGEITLEAEIEVESRSPEDFPNYQTFAERCEKYLLGA
jgi:hypothetical protein